MAKLFSIKEKYANKIFSKEKLVEFRRQNVNVNIGEVCLIYTSSPVKKITGYFIVKDKIRTSIKKLWAMTKDVAGISYNEFLAYFKDCEFGTAIVLKSVKKFSNEVHLEDLRKRLNFKPPQSYYNLNLVFIKTLENMISKDQIVFS